MSRVFLKRLKDEEGPEAINRAVSDLAQKAHVLDVIQKDDFTGLKIHFGERKNEGFIRPAWLKSLIGDIKKITGNLFFTDANVLYRSGSRWNSVGHLNIAREHGFDTASLGVPVIISDGIMGRSYRNVAINKKHFKEVKIAADLFDINALVSLAHVTGHMQTSLAASIKNIGMGCASRAGKLEQHSNATPEIAHSDCTGCGLCVKWCPEKAIYMSDKKAAIDASKCVGCGECTVICRYDAIKIIWSEKIETMQEKMAEYAYGVKELFGDKICFFNFLINITRDCDCMQEKVKKITPDIGVLASLDPVAIDKAAVDLMNGASETDILKKGYPEISWEPQIRYAEELGLGTATYELVEV